MITLERNNTLKIGMFRYPFFFQYPAIDVLEQQTQKRKDDNDATERGVVCNDQPFRSRHRDFPVAICGARERSRSKRRFDLVLEDKN
jgi:hypothetical protein